MSARQDHAIVVGGSMAGLLAARALADHYGRVSIVDRDAFPDSPAYRKGVPQSPHVHVLLARGHLVLEHLFPGLIGEIRDQGAVMLTVPDDILAHTEMGWAMRTSPRPLQFLSCGRELFEFNVRRRVAAIKNVAFVENTEVDGLVGGSDSASIVGVHVSPRSDGGADTIDGDLVVDATGRASRLPDWLAALGYERPPETTVVSRLGYASRYYARPAGFSADWKALFFIPVPSAPRGGVMFPIEGDRWLVTLAGVAGDYPPTDERGFLEFARSLRTPILYEVIRRSAPLSTPRGFRRTENVRREYERLERWPDGLIVTGDAACTFNPVYGQGMTVCAIEALDLGDALVEDRGSGFAQRVQRRLARVNSVAWTLATAADLAYSTTEGQRRGGVGRAILGRYMARLQTVAIQDAIVAAAFREVTHLLKPPSSLMAPSIAARVLAPRRIRRRDVVSMQMSFGPTALAATDAAPPT